VGGSSIARSYPVHQSRSRRRRPRDLTHLIEDAFAGPFRVFVSSDRDSLPPGVDWLEAIWTNLREADEFVILLTPPAVVRPWVHFEAGAAFGRSKRFIPVCTRGPRIGDVQRPLSSRQLLAMTTVADVEAIITALAEPYGYMPKPDRTKLELVEKLAMFRGRRAHREFANCVPCTAGSIPQLDCRTCSGHAG
jgi:TIR domain